MNSNYFYFNDNNHRASNSLINVLHTINKHTPQQPDCITGTTVQGFLVVSLLETTTRRLVRVTSICYVKSSVSSYKNYRTSNYDSTMEILFYFRFDNNSVVVRMITILQNKFQKSFCTHYLLYIIFQLHTPESLALGTFTCISANSEFDSFVKPSGSLYFQLEFTF